MCKSNEIKYYSLFKQKIETTAFHAGNIIFTSLTTRSKKVHHRLKASLDGKDPRHQMTIKSMAHKMLGIIIIQNPSKQTFNFMKASHLSESFRVSWRSKQLSSQLLYVLHHKYHQALCQKDMIIITI